MVANQSKLLERLVADLVEVHHDNLASIMLYGSTAAGDKRNGESRHNVLVVLRRLAFDDLRRTRDALRSWRAAGQPTPVLFTVDELRRAADVFPIEFLQMENARQVLHGSDAFEFVEISQTNLRRQTEYELRTKLSQLRRLFASETLSPRKLSALMIDSFSSFAALFRAVLILHGQQPAVANADAVRATISLLGLDGSPFEWILKQRSGETRVQHENDVNAAFEGYLAQIARVIEAVDQLEH
jgi:hypothetical protein